MAEASANQSWVYKGLPVRNLPENRMVNISHVWKAEGEPSHRRPDKWFKTELVQERLEAIAKVVNGDVSRDKEGKITRVPGVLEVLKGGRDLAIQGTYVSYELASDYFSKLSVSAFEWFTKLTEPKAELEPEPESSHFSFPATIDDFDGNVRFTPDGRIAVYDAIAYATGKKNPRQVWSDLELRFPAVVQKTDNWKFPGARQRLTPVATLPVFLEILVLLPGKLATAVREEAVRTLIRAMRGDPSLVEEILNRIHNPQDLEDIETSIRNRRTQAYGSDVPLGTMDNPITYITSEIKNSFIWKNKAEQMTNLLSDLATHRGMFIQRESPHRPYSSTAKNAKSRRIDLVLQSIEQLETLHIYQFKTTYIDDLDVCDVFSGKAYPEIAYRDFSKKGIKQVVAHLVAPAGITGAGVERLKQIQAILDQTYQGRIKLDAMRLDELVWGEMYPAIEERYRDTEGKFGSLHLNDKVKKLCKKLCETPQKMKPALPQIKLTGTDIKKDFEQLTLFPLLFN